MAGHVHLPGTCFHSPIVWQDFVKGLQSILRSPRNSSAGLQLTRILSLYGRENEQSGGCSGELQVWLFGLRECIYERRIRATALSPVVHRDLVYTRSVIYGHLDLCLQVKSPFGTRDTRGHSYADEAGISGPNVGIVYRRVTKIWNRLPDEAD